MQVRRLLSVGIVLVLLVVVPAGGPAAAETTCRPGSTFVFDGYPYCTPCGTCVSTDCIWCQVTADGGGGCCKNQTP